MQQTSRFMRRALSQYKPHQGVIRTAPWRIASQRLRATPNSSLQPSFTWGLRYQSSVPVAKFEGQDAPSRPKVPTYQLTFTCKPCGHRSKHNVSKQGYHKGTVLVTCPSCVSRHVISDHLKIFMDEASTLEDILKRTAGTDKDISKLLKKGRLGQRDGQLVGNEGEEDIEFWEDGTESEHKPESSQ